MPKTVILDVPDDFDFTKITPLINAGVGFRILKATEDYHVLDLSGVASSVRRKLASKANRGGEGIIPTIAGHFSPRGEFIAMQAQAWLKQAGYNPRSASPALTHLCKDGVLERIGTGKFRFMRPLAPGEEKTIRKSNATG